MDNDAAFLIKIFITDTYIKVLLMHVPKHSHVQVDVSDSISRKPFANHQKHSPAKAQNQLTCPLLLWQWKIIDDILFVWQMRT